MIYAPLAMKLVAHSPLWLLLVFRSVLLLRLGVFLPLPILLIRFRRTRSAAALIVPAKHPPVLSGPASYTAPLQSLHH